MALDQCKLISSRYTGMVFPEIFGCGPGGTGELMVKIGYLEGGSDDENDSVTSDSCDTSDESESGDSELSSDNDCESSDESEYLESDDPDEFISFTETIEHFTEMHESEYSLQLVQITEYFHSSCTSESVNKSNSERSEVDGLEAINRKWEEELVKISSRVDGKRKATAKKVTFAPEKDLVRKHNMVAWRFAYESSRKDCWQQYARDNERFRSRIARCVPILNPILTESHRSRVRERLQTFKSESDALDDFLRHFLILCTISNVINHCLDNIAQ